MKASNLRRQIFELCEKGIQHRAQINELLGQERHDRRDDITQLLQAASTERLECLGRALVEKRAIRQSYCRSRDQGPPSGCLVFHLFGFQSNREFFGWDAPDELVFAVSRVMRSWDYDQISAETMQAAVREELDRRRRASQAVVEVAQVNVGARSTETCTASQRATRSRTTPASTLP